MKGKIVSFILTGTILSLGLGTVLFSPKKAAVESEGYSISSLPTTIDLNDTSAANIRSYYSSLNNLSTSDRQGNNLLKYLKPILKNGQKYYSYDVSNGQPIWQMYEITDRDWDLSPASSTTYGTYNSSTNKITNYTYGTNSDPKNDPYVHSLYTNRNVTNQAKAWGDHTQTYWGINREHVWPKAEGFEDEATGGARGDPMHLMAGNGYANNIHSNYFYGYVDTSKTYTDCGSKYSYTAGNLLGKSKTLGGSTSVFEPQDSDKGDIARAIFYMVARYNYLSGSDSDGIDSDNPNLALTQSLSDWSSSSFNSTTTTKGYMGVMTDLLAWHHADPVDEYEIHRNNLLYTNFTNNRNPFIDFPEWADFIWGTATYSGSTYQSYSSTPTGYATPSSDTINGYNSGSVTPVESGTEDNPYTVSEARTAIDASSTLSNKYTRGIVYQVDSYNSTYKSITYWISDDGTNSNGLEVYSGKGIGGADFASKDDIKIGDIVVVKGTLKKYNSTYEYDYNNQLVSLVREAQATSITATPNKTFYVGDTITTSDFTVKDNLDNDISTFSFANNNYQFQYSDAASGGELTNKTFASAITYSNLTCSLTVQVQRKAHKSGTVSDTLDVSYTGQSGNTYGSWSSKAAPNSNAQYAGHNAGSNSSIQLRSSLTSSTYYSGVVSTTSGGTLSGVSVVWNDATANGRTLNVYGNNSAYSSPNDLYDSSLQGTLLGTIVKGTSTSISVNDTYAFVGICSASGAMYLSSVSFTYDSEENPLNVANYIMYEDTTNQCSTKFNVAKGYFENLTKAQRIIFMTSDDYVISTAKTRFEAWARFLGKTIIVSNGDYVINNAQFNFLDLKGTGGIDYPIIIMVTILVASSVCIVGCCFFKRKKRR